MNTQSLISLIVTGALLIPGFTVPSYAEKTKKGTKDAEKDTTSVKKAPKTIEDFFKNETFSARGLFGVHLMDKKVYFEIPDSLLGRDFIMGSTIKSISDNANGVVGSKGELMHFTFTKVDSTIQMRKLSTDVVSDGPRLEQSLAKSNGGGVKYNFEIKIKSRDGQSSVIDVTKAFLNGDKEMGPFLKNSTNAAYSSDEQFKSDLSFINGAKAFSDNVSVTSTLTYTYSLTNRAGRSVLKDAPLTAQMTRSILLLPKEVYRPRMADPRIGFFFTGRTRFGADLRTSGPVYFANRWRLEPSDTAAYRSGEVVEPTKPIVFYIDSCFPEWWKPYIHEAVEKWNDVFGTIGFKNAVVAKDFPKDDPEFDPDNIKYSCIRYAPVGIRNAMGPSWVDPRSGEIINASVYVYHDVISLLSNWMFVQTSQCDPRVRTRNISHELLGDALMYVIKHEVGHTLGLMHNMSGSYVIPVESLRDPEFTRKNGTTTSIMDYARFNYVAQPGDMERGVRLTPPDFGKYDYWAIRWGYTPVFDVPTFEEEAKITERWITDSLKVAPFYHYGKQQMSYPFFDPRNQVEDLGDDAIKATEYGMKNLKYIADNFMKWIPDSEDPDYEYRLDLYEGIAEQYLKYLGHVCNNVGGLYVNEVLAGDGEKKFQNVPAEKQKESLKYVFKMWDELDWIDNAEAREKLPIIGKISYILRRYTENQIFSSIFNVDKADGIDTHEFSYKDCMEMVFDFVWDKNKETDEGRALQRDFVDSFIAFGAFPDPNMAKSSLTDERELLGEFKANPVGGFEWQPRAVMNPGTMTKAAVWTVLDRARTVAQKRMRSGSLESRAHYSFIVDTINYSIGK